MREIIVKAIVVTAGESGGNRRMKLMDRPEARGHR